MAHFVFTSDGHFVNVDLITAMKIKGMIGKLDAIEIWFAGGAGTREPGLTLRFESANELFEEMLRMHKMIGWTASDPEDSTTPPEEKKT
ncbi:MAG TPA: hypothetical protein VHS31_16035 [Tepidisphaeraceae bacterium]|jgi:hypothetical protein|nr:hypothetical protein [Tepidisphaeraceae bacterium]